MKLPRPGLLLPSWQNALLAAASAVLLILAFPDFDLWFLAWVALVPLMWAIGREQASTRRSFVLGWLFGTVFFFGTCWWLTFAPITYAGFPPILAYFLLFCVTVVAGLFPAIFAGVLSILLRRFGSRAFLAAPFVWVFTEFLRYWLTGNNWNAIAYSQALASMDEASWTGLTAMTAVAMAQLGGTAIVGFIGLIPNTLIAGILVVRTWKSLLGGAILVIVCALGFAIFVLHKQMPRSGQDDSLEAFVVAIQSNVPMNGLDLDKRRQLRDKQVEMAESAIKRVNKPRITGQDLPTLVILPESPMNFMYEDDPEFQKFINAFAARNNVNVLFNSAEPDKSNGKYFNSAVMVAPDGSKAQQYDKIYLLPFGEAVPWFLEGIVPGFVGNFSYGSEYDLFPLGDAKAGVMICFESHFGQLSREYVRNGADVIIEMTNDGYLGPTPVLRQHLANAVFRAVETNRPVLRVTNVGITAYINERGVIGDSPASYTEDVRVWSVPTSDGEQTFYVRYGDWFAWVCTIFTVVLMGFAIARRPVRKGG